MHFNIIVVSPKIFMLLNYILLLYNSLLLGSPEYIIQKLQRVQNCAARLVAGQPSAAHIRPVLKELHWLPVE